MEQEHVLPYFQNFQHTPPDSVLLAVIVCQRQDWTLAWQGFWLHHSRHNAAQTS